MVADVDGTPVTREKPHAAGVLFAITSGRPAHGMAMLVEPLGVTSPIAAFHGGLLSTPTCRRSSGGSSRPG
jgi:hydroxymethylpyrimidine pyrophosphatase-like HAD family hydrolase